MEKQPFTQTGLQQLLAELYALPTGELNLQAQALLTDPKAWITEHFLLSAAQQDFLDQLPQPTLDFLGSQGSIAISNQLPITLEKEGDPEEDDGKLFNPKSSFAIAQTAQQTVQTTGEMTLEVIYGSQ